MKASEGAVYLLLCFILVYILIFVLNSHSQSLRHGYEKNGLSVQPQSLGATSSVAYINIKTTAETDLMKETKRIWKNKQQQKVLSKLVSKTGLSRKLKQCKNPPPNLKGREKILRSSYYFITLEEKFSDVTDGGHFVPKDCKPSNKVAIIVPYRDRDLHLKLFLLNMIPKLKRQLLDFTIFVVEQAPGSNFNRGLMRNIGFVEASKFDDYDCYIFNDVDTILENDRNIYRCGRGSKVRHLMAAVDRFNYRLMYASLVGGVIAFTKEQFYKVNGYANQYFVWGSEDDDLARRIRLKNMTVERPSQNIGMYTTLAHTHQPRNNLTDLIYNSMQTFADTDGLNSLKYTVIHTEYRKLYTWIYVKVDEAKIKQNVKFPFYSTNS